MKVTSIGIDLTKTVFSIHGSDPLDKVVVHKRLNRPTLLVFFAQLPSCLVGVEACSSAHCRAREMTRLGHDLRIITPRFVAPYRKSSKNAVITHTYHPGLGKSAHKEAECRVAVSNRFGFKWLDRRGSPRRTDAPC